MMWNWKRYIVGGFALSAAVALTLTVISTSVRADQRYTWDGVVLGGLIGGAIGSTIGEGPSRAAAIGAGALLGGLYGHHLTERHHIPRVYHHPVHRQHWRHGLRSHQQAWHAPRHRYHRGHYHGHYDRWKRAHTSTPVVVVPATSVVVDPRPVAVDRALSSDYVILGSEGMAPRQHRSAPTECRVLEDGRSLVYACRDAGGAWSILR